MKIKKSESGQALFLLVFGIISLIGFTALAIDGGRLYSERRTVQGVSDTAAFTGAVFIGHALTVTDTVLSNAVQGAFQIAKENGYDDADANVTVTAAITRDEAYYVVTTTITSEVDPTFAQLVYNGPMTVSGQAVVRVLPLVDTVFGNALFAFNKTQCNSIDKYGSGILDIDGSGIFSNSSCDPAISFRSGAGKTYVEENLEAVGKIYVAPPAEDRVEVLGDYLEDQPQVPIIDIPEPDCTGLPWIDKSQVDTNGVRIYKPGVTHLGVFIEQGDSPSKKFFFKPGLYCINGEDGFSIKNGRVDGDYVMFYITNGPVTINGAADVVIGAGTEAKPVYDAAGEKWVGMLFYVTSGDTVTLNGNALSEFHGTIFAPYSLCKLNGGDNTVGYDLSLVCDRIELGGNGKLWIDFHNANHYQPPTTIDLIE